MLLLRFRLEESQGAIGGPGAAHWSTSSSSRYCISILPTLERLTLRVSEWKAPCPQTSELVENALPKELVEATKRDLKIFVSTVTDESAKGIAHTAQKIQHDFNLKQIEGKLRVGSSEV